MAGIVRGPKKEMSSNAHLFFVEVAGVEPNNIYTDNQRYTQTQKLTPTKTPSVCYRADDVK